MKTLTSLFVLVCVLVAFQASALCADIPGGICFKTENGEILYQDFRTNTLRNILQGLTDPYCDGEFAVDYKGTVAVWERKRQLNLRRLPRGKAVKINTDGPLPSIRNLTISSRGTGALVSVKVSFEYTKAGGMAWVQVPSTSSLFQSWMQQGNPNERAPFAKWPMFVKQPDTCNAIHVSDLAVSETAGDVGAATLTTPPVVNYDSRSLGNVAQYPPEWQFKTTPESYGSVRQEPPVSMNRGRPLNPLFQVPKYGPSNMLELTMADAMARYSFKRNARVGCWTIKSTNPNDQLFAFVFQCPTGCTIGIYGRNEIPLELMGNLTPKDLRRKPGLYEINGLLTDFQGLAWMPNGNLSVKNGKKIYTISREKIDEGINQSGIARNPGVSNLPVPVRNVFSVRPDVAADEVEGVLLAWTGDQSFLYRSKGLVYHWDAGETKLAINAPPARFQYLNPDTGDVNAQTLASTKEAKTEVGGWFISSGSGLCDVNKLIRLSGWIWTTLRIEKKAFNKEAFFLQVAGFGSRPDLKFKIFEPGEIHPHQIQDPTVYEDELTTEIPAQKKVSLRTSVMLDSKQTILIKQDKSWFAEQFELTGRPDKVPYTWKYWLYQNPEYVARKANSEGGTKTSLK